MITIYSIFLMILLLTFRFSNQGILYKKMCFVLFLLYLSINAK